MFQSTWGKGGEANNHLLQYMFDTTLTVREVSNTLQADVVLQHTSNTLCTLPEESNISGQILLLLIRRGKSNVTRHFEMGLDTS